METMLMPKRNKMINPSRTRIKKENFATMEFEFKNSLDPDKNESTEPELKLLKLGRENPESGPVDIGSGGAPSPLLPLLNGFWIELGSSPARPPLLLLLLLLPLVASLPNMSEFQ